MDTGSRMQTAIVLDELPSHVLTAIEENPENLEAIKTALRDEGVKLAGYFDKIKDPEDQVNFTAQQIYNLFQARKNNPKTEKVAILDKSVFLELGTIISDNSNGKIRVAFNEEDTSSELQKEAAHFLKLNEERLGRDFEVYGLMAEMSPEQALSDFLEIVLAIKNSCPESYEKASAKLKELGSKVYKNEILTSWNACFDSITA